MDCSPNLKESVLASIQISLRLPIYPQLPTLLKKLTSLHLAYDISSVILIFNIVSFCRGFCYFNSVAIAARLLRLKLSVERVLIVDWVSPLTLLTSCNLNFFDMDVGLDQLFCQFL